MGRKGRVANEEASKETVGPLKPGTKLTARQVSEVLRRLNSGAFRPARRDPWEKNGGRDPEARW